MADEVVKEKGKRGGRRTVEKKFLIVSSSNGNGKVAPREADISQLNEWANNPMYKDEIRQIVAEFAGKGNPGDYIDVVGLHVITRVK